MVTKDETRLKATVRVDIDMNLLMQLLSKTWDLSMPYSITYGITRYQLEKKLKEEPKEKKLHFKHILARGDFTADRHRESCREIRELAQKIMKGTDQQEDQKEW
jgi:hypothetical protein